MALIDGLAVEQRGDSLSFSVRVSPGASRQRLMGIMGDALKVAVAAPPEGGRANDALVRYLAKLLDVRRDALSVESGHTGRTKRIAVTGLGEAELRSRLSDRLPA
jgi:uncharacterized protein (TIGR00251 family)